jgi:putative acetyltransferase
VEGFVVSVDRPDADDVQALLEQHLAFARRHTPLEDVHALDIEALLAEDVTFFSLREDGALLGVAALRRLDDTHVELKSMHTVATARQRGVGRALVDHVVGVARDRGCARVSLETASKEAFGPSRALYAAAGFEPCPPFADYEPGPNRVCMTRRLDEEVDG